MQVRIEDLLQRRNELLEQDATALDASTTSEASGTQGAEVSSADAEARIAEAHRKAEVTRKKFEKCAAQLWFQVPACMCHPPRWPRWMQYGDWLMYSAGSTYRCLRSMHMIAQAVCSTLYSYKSTYMHHSQFDSHFAPAPAGCARFASAPSKVCEACVTALALPCKKSPQQSSHPSSSCRRAPHHGQGARTSGERGAMWLHCMLARALQA